jgi:hypothetical protein
MDTAASQWLSRNLAAVIVAIAQANATLAAPRAASASEQQLQATEAGADE